MKNYLFLLGFLCLGITAQSQLERKPKLNPLSIITEIKPGSVLRINHNKNIINPLQRTPEAILFPSSEVKFPLLAYQLLISQLDGMPLVLPTLQGLAPMPVVKPSESFRSEMPIKDLPSQYR